MPSSISFVEVAQPRMLPHEFPAWKTVYHYFRLWRTALVWQQMNQALREMLRRRAGRESTPSAAIVDSQEVLTTEVAQAVGYDGAKLVKGHKRHVLVDTLGLLLQVIVSAANLSERVVKVANKPPSLCTRICQSRARICVVNGQAVYLCLDVRAGSALILKEIVGQFPRLQKIFSDGGYEGKDFAQAVKDDYHLDWEVVKRKQSKGNQRVTLALDCGKNPGLVSASSAAVYRL